MPLSNCEVSLMLAAITAIGSNVLFATAGRKLYVPVF